MAFPQDGAPVLTSFAFPGGTAHLVTMPATPVAGEKP